MPVCGYVVVPEPGESAPLARRLRAEDGCEVVPARNDDMLLLVTMADSLDEDAALRRRIEALPGIQALLMTFGEIDPDTREADPLQAARRGSRADRLTSVEDARG